MSHARNTGTLAWITAVAMVLLGLAVAVGGAWLLRRGGSPYYLFAGLAVVASGALLPWRPRAARKRCRRAPSPADPSNDPSPPTFAGTARAAL